MTHSTPNRPERRTPIGATAGVIDTISDAVWFVIQRPWLMIVPIAIDLILWLLVKVTMGPVIDNLIRLMETSDVEGSSQIIEQLRATGDQVMISDYLGAFVPTLLTGMSLDTLMGILMLFVAPEGFGVPRADIYGPWQDGIVSTFSPDSTIVVPVVWVAALLASSVAMILYRVPMVRAIRGTRPTGLLREMVGSWIHFLGYLLVLFLGACASLVPLAILGVLLPILGVSIAFVFGLGMLIFGGMFGVYFLFAVDAMLVHRTSALSAFRMSYAVGRTYFGQAVRFAILSIFLMLASLRLWSELAGTAPGFIIALIGSAFVGTVLTAASIFFYTDRFRLVRADQAGRRTVPMQH